MISLATYVQEIHRTPALVVMAVTGGGSGAISELLQVPGASRTLIEAIVPYGREAQAAFLGRAPASSCSPDTAAALAHRALEIARQRRPDSPRLLGLGATASLASDRPKRGDHRCHVAVSDGCTTHIYSLVLEKGRRDRAGEETLVAALILRSLGRACGLRTEPHLALGGEEQVTEDVREETHAVAALLAGRIAVVSISAQGQVAAGPARAPGPRALLPGAFNPLHHGHRALAAAAGKALGVPVEFELSVENLDKGLLAAAEVERRASQFAWYATVHLTRAPTFVDKARLFPQAVFVVGVDTAERIVAPRYYAGHAAMLAALEEERSLGCRFLVAGRADDTGRFRTLRDVAIPDGFQTLFAEIPEAVFRVDVSSTELRRREARRRPSP